MRAVLGGSIGLFGDDELVVIERDAGHAPIVRRPLTKLTAIDDDAETGPALERDRQELEQLGISARDHNPITGHAVIIISADSISRIRAHRASSRLAHP